MNEMLILGMILVLLIFLLSKKTENFILTKKSISPGPPPPPTPTPPRTRRQSSTRPKNASTDWLTRYVGKDYNLNNTTNSDRTVGKQEVIPKEEIVTR